MDSVLDYLLTASSEVGPLTSVPQAWQRHQQTAELFDAPVDAALACGFGADRLGYAFLSGYQAALRAMVPDLAPGELVSLCATEQGGGHPAAIRTEVIERDGESFVDGTKTFATLGAPADRLVVIGSVGADADGRNRLRAVLVDSDQPSVARTALPETPFIPEIPHAVVTFTGARARALPGDGYSGYLKPFRTIEDIHVLAAALGWLIRMGRRGEVARPLLEQLLATAATLRDLGRTSASSPGAHIALGGVLARFDELPQSTVSIWERAEPVDRERWERDLPLLRVAGKVRGLRLEAAWQTVRGSAD
ncbi:acyl-CoA dehydrogenase [Nocardia cyriacigeorgica]|uniref:Acyl-CoA dehydrogenase n=1 Tax=Nocardia cyriacigeorgica TaxID=135487 RepID=A0ABX0CDU9_9NOCA|nr:acyl-CoA dehydrogenase family protein [Nocardia cyriacigeorgica]NEW49304.1 acyl-CoA dehydrogenase [Nocardia cyriacigeorgica]NEW54207.1 acyl-CoA dehydrogenase [Nocardia cyriacigeorgica]